MKAMDINQCIENLLSYAKNSMGLTPEDLIYARNQLLDLFKVDYRLCLTDNVDLQTQILDPMVEYAVKNRLTDSDSALRFETRIMGMVTPPPSFVVSIFDYEREEKPSLATDYLYNVSVKSNYIRMCDVKKNIKWMTKGSHGDIGITINLAKPEKDAKQIEAEKNQPKSKYPACMLCAENLGFAGTLTHPARQTLRYAPITLGGEDWYLQYSPYVYYDEHCIAFSSVHTPMSITESTFQRLLDFAEQFPHYFMGSNADLPIVGGSILSHDHYQGGKKVLPMFSRPLKKTFDFAEGVTVGIRDWYNSVIHISSPKKFLTLDIASAFLECWRAYSDESAGIYHYTNAPHNTITPIGSMNEKGEYCLDLILRNNRTDEKHPFGIYHPTEDMHNIKKEGIGLIEAMGLFILPGRLKKEISLITDILSSGKQPDFASISASQDLSKHFDTIVQLSQKYGTNMYEKEAQTVVMDYVNDTCERILGCTAVYKDTREHEAAFDNFILHTKKKFSY